MALFIGTLLALASCTLGRLAGLDRDRAFYPVMMIVIASYYCLFAALDGAPEVLAADTAVAMGFILAAIIGFRTSPWLIVAALATHGLMDMVHHLMIDNRGVPGWWPSFCAAFDLTAALWLGWTTGRRRNSAGRA
jgi:hypothetical protein